ncbi:hypothetical protein BGZ82_004664, partial [Podila clonocystis]
MASTPPKNLKGPQRSRRQTMDVTSSTLSTTSAKSATTHKGAKAGSISRSPRPLRRASLRSALTDIAENAQANIVTTTTHPEIPIPSLQEATKNVLVAEKGYFTAKEIRQGQVTKFETVTEAMGTHVDQSMKQLGLEETHTETTTRFLLQNRNLN